MLIAGVCPQIAIGTYPGPHGDRQSRQQQWPAEAQDRPRPQPKELTALNGPQRRVLAGEAELLLTVGLGHRGKPRLCANHPTPGLPTVSEILRIPPPKTVEIPVQKELFEKGPGRTPGRGLPWLHLLQSPTVAAPRRQLPTPCRAERTAPPRPLGRGCYCVSAAIAASMAASSSAKEPTAPWPAGIRVASSPRDTIWSRSSMASSRFRGKPGL